MAEMKRGTANGPSALLRLIFESGPMGQVEAARRLGITKAGCNLHFLKLAADGLLESAPAAPQGGRGRPAADWGIKRGNYFTGVVLGRDGAALETIDFEGGEVYHADAAFPAGCGIEEICRICDRLLESALRLAPQRRVFVGIPGAIDRNGRVVNSPNFPALNGFDFERYWHDRFGVECYVDSSGLAVMRSETRRLEPDAVTLIFTWSEGVGADFSIQGDFFRPPGCRANRRRGLWDYGHLRIRPGGKLCHCGRRGCLEAYVGGVALLEAHPELQCRTVADFAGRIAAGDEAAGAVFDRAIEVIAESLWRDLELFGVENFVFTGAMRPVFERFERTFRTALERYAEPEDEAVLRILPGGADPVEFGAALVARSHYLDPERTARYRGMGEK